MLRQLSMSLEGAIQPTEWNRRVPGTGNRDYLESFEDGALYIATEIAGALAHAHSRGIFHGDLKPSNVLLTADGKPLLIDFNLATDRLSGTGPRGGTLAYMPPEQLAEIANDLDESTTNYDARSEIYTFGTLLFHLFTGHVPFLADENVNSPIEAAKCLIARQRSDPPTLRSKNPRVNIELERLILQCLAIEPANRPQTMLDVHADCGAKPTFGAYPTTEPCGVPFSPRSLAAPY